MFASLLLLLVAVVYRVVLGVTGSSQLDWWHNFSPLAAIALCGAVYLPKRMAIALPLAALFVSDLFLNAHYAEPLLTAEMLPRYLALGLCVALGLAVRRQSALPRLLGASVLGSLAFYFITNTASWIAEPLYAKTAAGWWQALVTGLPGYPPTLVFFRNSLFGDFMFTLLFATCMAVAQMKPAVSAKIHETA